MGSQSLRDFADRTAVVTGGGSGIGLAIARAFARRGAHVAIAGRNGDKLKSAAQTIIDETGADVFSIAADVSVEADCKRLLASVADYFGAVDILVNNAAHFSVLPLLQANADEAMVAFGGNLFGPLQCARAFAEAAIDAGRRGVIVNISSIAARRSPAGLGLYAASKAALESLTRTMAREWAPQGVRVNAIAPGHVETEGVLEDFRAGRHDQQAMLAAIPAGRIATLEEIADIVLFLASDAGRHIVGEVVTVDGGEGM